MYVIIGSHFVLFEGKFLRIALVIVRIALNVIVSLMPLNVIPPVAKRLSKKKQNKRDLPGAPTVLAMA
jgi:hypothetical protein